MPRMFRWNWLGALALAACPTLALGQAAAPQTHTVRAGDTLWDLAKQYRGDPFLWPDIYRMNTNVVEDPHWIYPGEVLRLSASADVASVPAVDTPAPTDSAQAQPADSAPVLAADTVASADTTASMVAVSPIPVPATPAPAPQDTAAPVPAVAVVDQTPSDERTLAQLTAASIKATEGEAAPLFGPRHGEQLTEDLRATTEKPYRALRVSEFFSSGFLTEDQSLPFGKVIGPVTPQQVKSLSANVNATINTTIAVDAPRGATYQVGDSLLLAMMGPELKPYGDAVVPTGLARVVDTVSGRYVATVVAVYGPIREGQLVMPAEKFTPSGNARALPVSEGVVAHLIGGPGRQDLKAPQMVVFLDKGRQDGVAPGDLFEARRRPARMSDGSQRVDELMATMQVVHVRDHTATARLINILSPDIAAGTKLRQVAKLPS
ncbi:MAG TPA: LysM peptidoglycan-binding domain-containing protein [Gemmatimonadales bacterium]